MAGLDDVVQASLAGGKPGPATGTDPSAPTPFSPEAITAPPRAEADLIMQALGKTEPRPRRERALNRRAARNG